MESKIKIKMGAIEVEYEGTEDFIKNDLLDLVSSMAEFHSQANAVNNNDNDRDSPPGDDTGSIQGTTGNFAAKLKCKTGPDLIIAALAHLTLVKSKKSSTRSDILTEMQSATTYYKKSYSGGNFSTNLKNLEKSGKLLEQTKNNYALQAKELKSIEAKLAQ